MKIRRTRGRGPRIEMLPLIDIVFLLLVFFIYGMLSMAVHRGLDLDLPTSSQARPGEELPLPLSLKLEGEEMALYLDQERIALDDLGQQITARRQGEAARGVQIFADKDLSYQQLFLVLDHLRQSRVENISLQANAE